MQATHVFTLCIYKVAVLSSVNYFYLGNMKVSSCKNAIL